jgi:hypothetical protein
MRRGKAPSTSGVPKDLKRALRRAFKIGQLHRGPSLRRPWPPMPLRRSSGPASRAVPECHPNRNTLTASHRRTGPHSSPHWGTASCGMMRIGMPGDWRRKQASYPSPDAASAFAPNHQRAIQGTRHGWMGFDFIASTAHPRHSLGPPLERPTWRRAGSAGQQSELFRVRAG